MSKAKTLTDWILYNVIGLIFTPDEWHAFITGVFDGLSFSKEGKFSRKVAKIIKVKTKAKKENETDGAYEHWDVLEGKPWYYNLGYQVGEYLKIGSFLVIMYAANTLGVKESVGGLLL